MQTESIDRLFLELSQVTKATTKKELDLLSRIDLLEKVIVKISETEGVGLKNRADGVDGHYCLEKSSECLAQYYTFDTDSWGATGTVIDMK